MRSRSLLSFLTAGSVVVTLCAICISALIGGDRATSAVGSSSRPREPSSGAPSSSRGALGLSGAAFPAAASGSGERAPAEAPAQTRRAFVAVLERHRKLAEKAVPLGKERAELNELLSDPSNLSSARERLLQIPPVPLDRRDEQERMEVVRFVEDALRYQANPARSRAMEVAREVILSSNHREIADEDVRRSIVADKVELFLAMLLHAPEDATALEAEAKRSANAKIVEYAAGLGREETRHE